MRDLKSMPTDQVAVTTTAARALYNVGWRIYDIAQALDLSEVVIREVIKIQI